MGKKRKKTAREKVMEKLFGDPDSVVWVCSEYFSFMSPSTVITFGWLVQDGRKAFDLKKKEDRPVGWFPCSVEANDVFFDEREPGYIYPIMDENKMRMRESVRVLTKLGVLEERDIEGRRHLRISWHRIDELMKDHPRRS